MPPRLSKLLFETLYRNRYLYRFASTVPFAGQWRTWQRLVLPRLQGHDVLELGCGLGDLLADMLEAGYDGRAIEHSSAMVAAARDTLRKRKAGTGTHVIQGVAQSLPFADETFDNVVSTFPSEYIYDTDTISEVKRVLRPGGRLIIVTGANLLPVGYIQPLLMFIHFLVYGPGVFSGLRKQPNHDEVGVPDRQGVQAEKDAFCARRDTSTDAITAELPDAPFGRLIPLERSGMRRRSQRVYSCRWEVYITIGEKPDANLR